MTYSLPPSQLARPASLIPNSISKQQYADFKFKNSKGFERKAHLYY